MIQVHIETIYLLRVPEMKLQPYFTRFEVNLSSDGGARFLHRRIEMESHSEGLKEAEEWIRKALVKFDPPRKYRLPGERLISAESESP